MLAEQLKEQGNRFLSEGRLREAEGCYRRAIEANPGYAIAYLNLGFVLKEQERHDEAEVALSHAVALDSQQWDAWYLLGKIAVMQGRIDAGIERLSQAVEIRPTFQEARRDLVRALFATERYDRAREMAVSGLALDPGCTYLNFLLGMLCLRVRDWDKAAECFRREIELNANFAEAQLRLGQVLERMGALEEATDRYLAARAIEPGSAVVHRALGNVQVARGDVESAIASYRRAIELSPEDANAQNDLGIAYQRLGKVDAAIASFRAALAIDSNYANAHANLGVVLHLCGNDDEAVEHFRRALALEPKHPEARHNIGSVLLKQGDLDEAITYFLEVLRVAPAYADAFLNLGMAYRALGRFDDAETSLRRAIDLARGTPTARSARSNLLLVESGRPGMSAAEYLADAKLFGTEVLAGVTPYVHWLPAPNGPLRVGLVSGDLRAHPVGFFLEGVLEQIDVRSFTLIAYSTTYAEDAITARLRPRFAEWRVIAGASDEAAARCIHDDRIDILVDLAGHTADNRLGVFAWKPAPVQVSWLGYWASTGVPSVDYLLADPISVPPESESGFTEAIWHLPETRLCFTAPTPVADRVVGPLPAAANGHVTFGCYQNLAKLTDATLMLWGRVMRANSGARLRLQDKYLGYAAARMSLEQRLAAVGIAPERVAMYGRIPHKDYLATYAEVDLVLDTFPFCGGTTTCEALWMGVPTLTLAGQTLVSRQGASMLTCVGLSDWVAWDEDAYVAKASRFASDFSGLSELRATLRQRVLGSPLFDAPRFARNLEAALRGMWAASNVGAGKSP